MQELAWRDLLVDRPIRLGRFVAERNRTNGRSRRLPAATYTEPASHRRADAQWAGPRCSPLLRDPPRVSCLESWNRSVPGAGLFTGIT
jgi:hypothetical protein